MLRPSRQPRLAYTCFASDAVDVILCRPPLDHQQLCDLFGCGAAIQDGGEYVLLSLRQCHFEYFDTTNEAMIT